MTETNSAARPSPLAARPHPVGSIVAILLLFVFSGVAVQILPVAAPGIIADWQLSATALAAPVSAVLVGSALGTVIGGILSDIIGRRPLIAGSVALLAAFMALTALASAPWHITATMLVAGLAMGFFFSPGMALVAELSPPHRRALSISLTVASLPLGLTLCSLAASVILPALGWEMLFLVGAALGVPCLLLFVAFVPESPSFLVKRPGREAEYAHVQARLSLPPVEIPTQEHGETSLVKRFGQLFTAAPVTTACLFVLFLATNMFGNMALSWIPTAMSDLGFSLAFSSGSLASWTTVTVLATPVAGWLMTRIGLNLVCAVALVISGTAMVLMGAFASVELGQGAISAMMALSGLGCAGFVTAVYTLAAESFPAELRGSGIGISDAIGRVGGVLGAYFGVQFMAAGGPNGFFYLLALLMAVSLVFLAILASASKPARPKAGAPA